MTSLTVVGVGPLGAESLCPRARQAVRDADVLVGGQRLLEMFPESTCDQISLAHGIVSGVDDALSRAGTSRVCMLASGDPLFFGIAGMVTRRLSGERVDIMPNVSSLQLAFARAGWPWQDARLISLHGRPLAGLVTRLRHHASAGILTDTKNQPATIAAHLLEYCDDNWDAVVCEDLGTPSERVRRAPIADVAAWTDMSPLNVLLLRRRDPSWTPPASVAGLPEESFARRMPRKGLITKREVRVLSIAQLRLRRNSIVWDVGAGSGSVTIEAAHIAHDGRTYAIEVDPEGIDICHDNVRAHGADNIEVIAGRAPEALTDLPDPDAVFVGGSKGSLDDIVDTALRRLRPGGRLVVNAVTLDNVHEAATAFRSRGIFPDVQLVQISRGARLAHYLRYDALNPIHVFAADAPSDETPTP